MTVFSHSIYTYSSLSSDSGRAWLLIRLSVLARLNIFQSFVHAAIVLLLFVIRGVFSNDERQKRNSNRSMVSPWISGHNYVHVFSMGERGAKRVVL